MKSEKIYPIGEEKVVFQGNIIEVVHQEFQEKGKTRTYEIARRAPGCRAIIRNSEGKILLTKEYRHESDDFDYRLPGGKVVNTLAEYNSLDNKKVDLILLAQNQVNNELREEAGISAKNLVHVHTSICGTTVNWDLIYFIGELDETLTQDPGSGEDVTRGWYTIEEVENLCCMGEMNEDRSMGVLLRYCMLAKKGQLSLLNKDLAT